MSARIQYCLLQPILYIFYKGGCPVYMHAEKELLLLKNIPLFQCDFVDILQNPQCPTFVGGEVLPKLVAVFPSTGHIVHYTGQLLFSSIVQFMSTHENL